jgi:hypothetical protein
MIEKCSVCKNQFPSYANKCTHTEDGKTICKPCYDTVADELFKGSFTYKEAIETMDFIKEFTEDIMEYLLIFKKHAIHYGDDEQGLLNKLYKGEDEVSELVFKVPRKVKAFTRKGKLELIQAVKSGYVDKIYQPLSTEQINLVRVRTDFDLGTKDLFPRYISML